MRHVRGGPQKKRKTRIARFLGSCLVQVWSIRLVLALQSLVSRLFRSVGIVFSFGRARSGFLAVDWVEGLQKTRVGRFSTSGLASKR